MIILTFNGPRIYKFVRIVVITIIGSKFLFIAGSNHLLPRQLKVRGIGSNCEQNF